MRSLNKKKQNRGVSIIAAMAIILIASVFTFVMASMLGRVSRISLDRLSSARAFAIAQGGLNWYMMQLAGTANWNTPPAGSNIALGNGTFSVTTSNNTKPETDSAGATRMDFTVTGNVSGSAGATIQRTMSQSAWQLPSATKFALFWGRDPTGSTNLTLTSTTINGDYWSAGGSVINSPSTVGNGYVYCPSNKTGNITGSGSYTTRGITWTYFPTNISGQPFTTTFSTPAINASYYTGLETAYDAKITGCGTTCSAPSTFWTLNTNYNLTGNTLYYGTVSTNTTNNTNVTISGNGFIVANTINLDALGSNANRVLTIAPSGGDIVIIARTTLTVGNGVSIVNAATTNTAGIRMYSASTGGTAGQILIRGSGVGMNSTGSANNRMLILAKRRLYVQASAKLYNSTLFVDYPASITNNVLYITGSGTTIGSVSAPCSIISIARGTDSTVSPAAYALTVRGGASVTGLVYQYDGVGNAGTTLISSVSGALTNIRGSLIANQFQGNAIGASGFTTTITYDPTAIPDPPPEGFSNFATKEPNFWSGS